MILVGVEGVVQTYAWGVRGSESLVARAARQTNPLFVANDDTPYAELWFGCHTTAPSSAHLADGTKQALPDWLKGQTMPFLCKVLSIAEPLSLQLHPDDEMAAKLHQEQPEHYKDPNSKPEAAIALGEAEVFCGFRKLREILMLAQSVPGFGKIVFGPERDGSDFNNMEESMVLEGMMKTLYSLSDKELKEVVDETLEMDPEMAQPVKKDPNVIGSALRSIKSIFKEEEMSSGELLKTSLILFRRLNAIHPYDRGLFAAFFLNYIRLRSGDVIALAPNTIHAYIQGNVLEIMKTSDNVIRAGLTSKFQDSARLLELVNYKSLSMMSVIMKPQDVHSKFEGSGKIAMKAYIPQMTDSFRFYTIHLSAASTLKDARIPDWSPMLILVIRGQCEVTGLQQQEREGEVGTDMALKTLRAGQAAVLSRGSVLGVRNLAEKSAKENGKGGKKTCIFDVTDFEAASAEQDCLLLVVISNDDASKVKRSARTAVKHSMIRLQQSNSPNQASVAEFPVVTPLEAIDAEPLSSPVRASTSAAIQPFPRTENVTEDTSTAQPEPTSTMVLGSALPESSITQPLKGNDTASKDDNCDVPVSEPRSNEGTEKKLEADSGDLTKDEVKKMESEKASALAGGPSKAALLTDAAPTAPKDQIDVQSTAAKSTEDTSVIAEPVAAKQVSSASHLKSSSSEAQSAGVSQEPLSPKESHLAVTSHDGGASEVGSASRDVSTAENSPTDVPLRLESKPRKPPATANEIAEVKIAKTLAKHANAEAMMETEVTKDFKKIVSNKASGDDLSAVSQ